jgi:Family of unknown function (DUF6361)
MQQCHLEDNSGMPSTLAWLDFSEEEQRRARELLAFYSEHDTRDELGIGTVRDALSDAMFPGTSVIQTRARYFLFVPWLFQEAARRGRSGPQLVEWVRQQERRLIEALRRGGEGGPRSGLIGRVAGTRVKILPSTIYWTGLQRFQILRRAGTAEQVAGFMRAGLTVEEALTELIERPDPVWDPNLPPPPADFFQMDQASFAMGPDEAGWLAERMASSAEGTFIEWLVTSRVDVTEASEAPWEGPAMPAAPAPIRRVVHHSKLFSSTMHGAALLYNLLIAERARDEGLDPAGVRVTHYQDVLEGWADHIDTLAEEVGEWSHADFWALVRGINPRIPLPTYSFVERWIQLASHDPHAVTNSEQARHLVSSRERLLKRSQSRLTNERMLRDWSGGSGVGRLTFRWPQVKVLLGDIARGRSADAGA